MELPNFKEIRLVLVHDENTMYEAPAWLVNQMAEEGFFIDNSCIDLNSHSIPSKGLYTLLCFSKELRPPEPAAPEESSSSIFSVKLGGKSFSISKG